MASWVSGETLRFWEGKLHWLTVQAAKAFSGGYRHLPVFCCTSAVSLVLPLTQRLENWQIHLVFLKRGLVQRLPVQC